MILITGPDLFWWNRLITFAKNPEWGMLSNVVFSINLSTMVFLTAVKSFLKDPEYRDLLVTSNVIIIVGTFVYHHLEGWSYLDSLYFSIITLTTIGYGDFSPQTVPGKIFTIFYILIGLGMILTFLHTVFRHYQEEILKTKKQVEKRRKNGNEENY